MLKPVNHHILVEPVEHKSFMASDKTTYEEIGTIISFPPNFERTDIAEGDRVYFDSWLAAKFPKKDGGFFWLVKWEDVRAVEQDDKIPTVRLS